MTHAGVYARISLDRRDGEGVARQLADCRELAAERGWTNLVEYVDNDISAFRSKRRPEYERLLSDLRAGRLKAVVAYHPDRLYRQPSDLEAFIDAVQAAGAEVATVKAGDVDLSTASGRMIARILGAVSRQESERIGERVSRAKRERAAQGRHSGGGPRPYGLTADRTAIVEHEAEVLREVARNILAGSSWSAETHRINAAGYLNTTGRQWTIGNLRRALTSPHITGLRAHHGEIVGEAAWPAIIDRDTWTLLRTAATGRRRPGHNTRARYQLTGLLACGRCGKPLFANRAKRRYVDYQCSTRPTTTGKGCGGISIAAHRADAVVVDTISQWLCDPAFIAALDTYLAGGDADAVAARAELQQIEAQMVSAAERWADGEITDLEYDAARSVLARRRQEAEARAARVSPLATTTIKAEDMAVAWGALTVAERRDVIPMIARCPITVRPGRAPDNTVVPPADRLDLVPIWHT